MSYTITPELVAYMEANIDQNDQPLVIGVLATALVVAYVAVALRFFARWKTRSAISYDDYAVLIGLVIVTGSNITMSHAVVYGFGRHVLLVTNRKAMIQSEIATQVLYTCSLPPIKLSILFLYHRIFPSKTLTRVSIAMGAFVVAYSIVQAVCMVVQCIPIDSFWTGQPATCINFAFVLMLCSILNVVTDVIILAMPIPLLWRLKIKRTKRLQLIGTFVLGGIVTGISIARTVLVAVPSSADKSWVDVGPAVISETEIAIAVLSACLPTYRPLLRSRVSKLPTGSAQYQTGASNVSASRFADPRNRASVLKAHALEKGDGQDDWVRLNDLESQTTLEPTSEESPPLPSAAAPASMQAPAHARNMSLEHNARGVVVQTDVRVSYAKNRQAQERQQW